MAAGIIPVFESKRLTEREALLRTKFQAFMESCCGWPASEFVTSEGNHEFIVPRIEELFSGYKMAHDEWMANAVELRAEIKAWMAKNFRDANIDEPWKDLVVLLGLDVKDLGW